MSALILNNSSKDTAHLLQDAAAACAISSADVAEEASGRQFDKVLLISSGEPAAGAIDLQPAVLATEKGGTIALFVPSQHASNQVRGLKSV